MSNEIPAHYIVPVLEILAFPPYIIEMCDSLRTQGVIISSYDETFQKEHDFISINDSELYASVRPGSTEELEISFYEAQKEFHASTLKKILSFVDKKHLRILSNRIGVERSLYKKKRDKSILALRNAQLKF